MGKIHIIGTGPGSPDYVLPAARKIVQVTEVIIGAQRSLSLFKEEIKGKSVSLTAENLKEVLQYAYECAKKGQTVAILSTGDPGFSGLLKSFLNNITIQDVEVEVVPGISAIQVCAARLGMSWDDAGLLTFHDTVTASKKLALLEYAKAHKDIMVFPNQKKFTCENISNYLLENGLTKNTRVLICENLTLPEENIVEMTLEQVSKQTFSPLCVMVIMCSSIKSKSSNQNIQ